MSRKGKQRPSRQLTDAELLNAFEQSLDTLTQFAKLYDDAYPPIVFAMATEVYKILTENGAATKLRGTRVFTTPIDDHGPNVLSALHKLTIAQVGGLPPTLSFLPHFYVSPERPLRNVAFKEWWHRDIIYRASAAVPGGPPGMIPVNGSPEVPYDERERITRMGLVNLLRNKLGAHQTSEMPVLLDDLEESRNWGSFAVQTPDGLYDTENGSLVTLVTPMAAMMRQIAHELLVSYNRTDTPPAPKAA